MASQRSRPYRPDNASCSCGKSHPFSTVGVGVPMQCILFSAILCGDPSECEWFPHHKRRYKERSRRRLLPEDCPCTSESVLLRKQHGSADSCRGTPTWVSRAILPSCSRVSSHDVREGVSAIGRNHRGAEGRPMEGNGPSGDRSRWRANAQHSLDSGGCSLVSY